MWDPHVCGTRKWSLKNQLKMKRKNMSVARKESSDVVPGTSSTLVGWFRSSAADPYCDENLKETQNSRFYFAREANPKSRLRQYDDQNQKLNNDNRLDKMFVVTSKAFLLRRDVP